VNSKSDKPAVCLGAALTYQPVPLRFGTSGRRGLVKDLTQLEVYINARAELEYLLELPKENGGIRKGDDFFLAWDLRPSSTRFVPEYNGRGEIAQTLAQAIRDVGLRPVNLGCIPTPALAFYAWQHSSGGMMVTGSHIPFDRNGYKTNSACGELLKTDEQPIQQRSEQLRKQLYSQPLEKSLFNENGMFKAGHQELPPENSAAKKAYVKRYLDFFAPGCLEGLRVTVYQHSAAGRDLLFEVLQSLGARAIPCGRTDTFVPIDTENVDATQLGEIQRMADEVTAAHGPIDAVVSTDGDSDRPLLIGIGPDNRIQFFGGDLVGMIVAEFLGPDAVVVPISCNDAIDVGPLRDVLQPKTRIGSPYVIAAMQAARAAGRSKVCGWEANGGFLTASPFIRKGRRLDALPTRDAFLPILSVLCAMAEQKVPMVAIFARLPRRFSRAVLLREVPRADSARVIQALSPEFPISEVYLDATGINAKDASGGKLALNREQILQLQAIVARLESFFTTTCGFGRICSVNYTDGVRIRFENGDVAHVRPSGNADELRLYAVANSPERVEQIAAMAVAPDGILLRLLKSTA